MNEHTTVNPAFTYNYSFPIKIIVTEGRSLEKPIKEREEWRERAGSGE